MNRNNWSTPLPFMDWVHSIWHPCLDVCALPENAQCEAFIGPPADPSRHDSVACIGVDAMQTDWEYGDHTVAWCNPPGNMVEEFARKALEQVKEQICHTAIVLTVTSDSEWYHDVAPYCETWLLRPRIGFDPPEGLTVEKNRPDRARQLLIFTQHTVTVPGNRVCTVNWKGLSK